MSSLSITTSRQASSSLTPFCDKNFQKLRLLSNTISRVCLAVIFTLAFLASWLFSKNISHHCRSHAYYHLIRSFSQPFAFFRQGSQLIDFSTNSVRNMKSINGANEVESLKGKYGSEVIKRWSEIESLKFPLKIEKLARMEMSADGCCFGMSMDFISRYLHEIKVGKTPLEAVKTIAPIYADGSPVEGELAQIFFDALDTSIAIKDYKAKWLPELENILKKDQDKALEEAASRLELDNVMKVKASEVDRLNPLDSHKIPLVQKLNEIRSKFYFDRALKKAEIAYGRFNIIAEKMGLSSRLIDFFHIEDAAEEAMDPRFPEFIDKLPLGAYQIGLLPQEGDGHSIAFIKTGEGCFLFEPSLATLTLTQAEAAKGLWHVGKELYLKKGACSMSLSLIEPA